MTISIEALELPVENIIIPSVRDLGEGFKVRRALPSALRRMVGPFIFLDHFGPIVFGAGAGANIRPHPHIGLSTLSYLLQGEMVHRDSLGNVQPIRAGDVNWMTAGSGIVHSERSPPTIQARGGALFGQQVWVALPKSLEEIQPTFSHHPAGTLPEIEGDGVSLAVIAGQAFGQRSPVPVSSDLMYVDVVLKPGAWLPVSAEHVERAVFIISGEIEIAGQPDTFGKGQFVTFKPGVKIILKARESVHLMLLGGEPFPEPRHIYWNFVSTSKERIEQAKDDWWHSRFSGIAGETEHIPLPHDPPASHPIP